MRHWLTSARLLLVGLAASGLLLTGPPDAFATPTWLPHVDLSAPDPGSADPEASATENATAPQVAVDPVGDATSIWARSDGTHSVIQTALRPAGGSWLPPANLSGAGEADIPQLAVDSQGDAVAVWSQASGGTVVIEASVRSPAGTWQAAPDAISDVTGSAFAPRLAVDAQGDAIAVWTRYDDPSGHQVVQVAERPAGGAWSAAADLTTADRNASDPAAALDARGDAVVVWTSSDGTNQIVQATQRPAGGAWTLPARSLTTDGRAITAQVAMSPNGAALAVWSGSDGSHFIVQAADRPAQGDWQPATALSATGSDALAAQVGMDPRGAATVVWQRSSNGTIFIQGASRPPGATWQPPVILSGTGVDSTSPQIAVAPAGAAVAVWVRERPTGTVVQAAASPSAGTWGTVEDLTGPGAPAVSPRVAIDAQGNAAAVWTRSDGFAQIAQAKGYDAAGPILPALSIPSAGTAGQVTSFSVSPLDVWSAVAQTTWSFGDGTTGDGAAVGHVYAAPGTYVVTVSSTDAVGFSASAAGSVTIAAAPPGPAGAPPPPTPLPAPAVLRAPSISRVGLTHRRFRVARKLSAAARRARPKAATGTSFRFTVSAPATFTVTITRRAAGLRRGTACVAPTVALRRRQAKRCTRTLTVGSLTHRITRAGIGRFAFDGRIRRRWLAPGAYRARLVARNAGGRSAPVSVAFTVIR